MLSVGEQCDIVIKSGDEYTEYSKQSQLMIQEVRIIPIATMKKHQRNNFSLISLVTVSVFCAFRPKRGQYYLTF